MKWIYMIVILIIGGMLVYYLFIVRQATPGSPRATAEDFVKASLNNDLQSAKNLCIAGAQGGIEPIFQRIRDAKPDKMTIQYNNMRTDPPRRGITVNFPGAMIAIEMIQESEVWKIVNITIN
jgi:hypothetical protein